MSDRNIPTSESKRWMALGAFPVRPNFDRPGYSIATFSSPAHALNATLTVLCEDLECLHRVLEGRVLDSTTLALSDEHRRSG
jgi:hypothetical protein